MKNILKYLAFAIVAISFASCQFELVDPDADELNAELLAKEYTFKCVFAKPDTKVAISNEGKTTWEPGDQILVHGDSDSYTVVTLNESDISIDRKVATISFSGVLPCNGQFQNSFFAQYPASGLTGWGDSFFDNTDSYLMAACDYEDSFVFFSVSGVITYIVDGDFDYVEFSSNNCEQVKADIFIAGVYNYGNGPVFNYAESSYSSDSLTKEVIADGKTLNYIYLPGGTTFTEGFTFRFYKDGKPVKEAVAERKLEVPVGTLVNLGDITWRLVDYVEIPDVPSDHQSQIFDARDLSDYLANCYVITEPGAYKFPAVKGNSWEWPGYVYGAEVLWETWNNNQEVISGSVVAEVDFQDDWIYFRTPDVLTPGNAVIAARNAAGKIIWSWHIWVPATEIRWSHYGDIYSNTLMDRNLGALRAAKVDQAVPVEAFGLTYQWGRKDPFPGPGSAESYSEPATVSGAWSECEDGMQLSLAQSIANPTRFGQNNNLDWLIDSDDTLWSNEVKTIYDPCPAGWRVPACDYNQPMMSSDFTTVNGWSENEELGYFTMGNPVTVFPLGGYRDDYGLLTFAKVFLRVEMWTAQGQDYRGVGLRERVANGGGDRHAMANIPKSRGLYVRCVAEEGVTLADTDIYVGNAKDGDVLWAEDWTGAEAGVIPEDYPQTGTTVFGGATVSYTSVSPSSITKVYNDSQINGTDAQENLLIAKAGGNWTIEGIPAAGATVATLSYKLNNKSSLDTKCIVSSPTAGVTIGERVLGEEEAKPFTAKHTITLDGVDKFTLEFNNTSSSNIRIDDIVLVVGESGAQQQGELAFEHVWQWYSGGGALWTDNVWAITVSHPDGYGMVRGLAMDDEYIYLPKSSAYAAVAAIKIDDPTVQVKGSVSNVAGGSVFATSFPRVIKNTDPSVNGGKDVLLVCNLTETNSDENKLVVYAYTNGIEAAPIILCAFCWDSANDVNDWRRYGDRFFVTGTWQEGKIWFPSFHSNKIVCLSVANGVRTAVTQYAAGADNSPEGIKDFTVWEGTDTQYLITNNSVANLLAPADGTTNGWNNLALNFACSNAVGTWGYNFFEFNGEQHIAYARMDGQKAWVEVIKQGVNLGRSIDNPSIEYQLPIHDYDSLDAELTTGGLADCCVRVIDGVPYIAALTRDGGIVVYKLVM